MEFKTMLYEKEGNIGIMTLNRPKVMNALDVDVMTDLTSILDIIEQDDEVKAAILTGSPKVFAAGGDIAYMLTITPTFVEKYIAQSHAIFNRLESFCKPIVAAISGMAFGGGVEIALACDIRIAAEGATLGLPESNLGLFPAAGGTQRVTRVAGIGWAKDLILTGEPITADTAFRIGLVTRVVKPEDLMKEAKRVANVLASKAPITANITKQSLNNSMYADMNSALLFDQKSFAYLFATEDHTEGLKAFIEKRKPEFKGK